MSDLYQEHRPYCFISHHLIRSMIVLILYLIAEHTQIHALESNCKTNPRRWGCPEKKGNCTLWSNNDLGPDQLPRSATPEYICLCKRQFNGPRCEYPNPCLSRPCLNGGQCSRISVHPNIREGAENFYFCHCPVYSRTRAFTGLNCETQIDEPCYSQPCQHGGSCIYMAYLNFVAPQILSLPHYTCLCIPPWTGPLCEQNKNDVGFVEDCRSSLPCEHNKGKCVRQSVRGAKGAVKGLKWVCVCEPMFHGRQCEFMVTDCRSTREEHRCYNGTCKRDRHSGNYSCKCYDDYNTDPQCRIYDWRNIEELAHVISPEMWRFLCKVATWHFTPIDQPDRRLRRQVAIKGPSQRTDDDTDIKGQNPCKYGAECVVDDEFKQFACVCKEGTSGKLCGTGCPFGLFGPECNQPCNKRCAKSKSGDLCDPITGRCHRGCQPGFTGGRCSERNGIEAELKMVLDGTYSRAAKPLIEKEVVEWSSGVCAQIKTSCSVDVTSVSPGSVVIEYTMIFNPTDRNKNRNMTSLLTIALQGNADKFMTGGDYQLQADSIKVERVVDVSEVASRSTDELRRGGMLVVVAGILSVSAFALVVLTLIFLKRRGENRRNLFRISRLSSAVAGKNFIKNK